MNFAAHLKQRPLFILLIFLILAFLTFNIFGFLYLRKWQKVSQPSLQSVVFTVGKKQINQGEYQSYLSYLRDFRNIKEAEERGKEELTELAILEQSADELGISISQEELQNKVNKDAGGNYLLKDNPQFSQYKKLELLREEIRREVTEWKSGGYITALIRGPLWFASKGEIDVEKIANDKINDYWQRAKAGEEIAVLVEEALDDKELSSLNNPGASSGKMFTYLNPSKSLLVDKKFDEELARLNKEETSPIFTIKTTGEKREPLGYVFIKVTETHEGKFQSYDQWLTDKKDELGVE